MKNNLCLYVLGILCSLTFSANARSGVYMTYNDFKNGNLLKADDKTFEYHFYKKNITMKVNGEKKKIEASEPWGFLLNDELYRIILGPGKMYFSCRLTNAGKFYSWYYSELYNTTSSTSTNYIGGGGTTMKTTTTHNEELTFLTYGINGEPFLMWRKKEMEKAVAAQKQFKPIMDCADSMKTKFGVSYINNLMYCLTQQEGYVSDTKSVIPPDKN